MSTLTVVKQNNNGEIPEPRIGASLNYVNGTLYLYGMPYNYDENNDKNGLIYSYNIDNQVWNVHYAQGEIPDLRYSHSAALYNDQIYIIYGFNDTLETYDIWKFNITSSIWSKIRYDYENYFYYPGEIQFNSTFYMLHGYSLTEPHNRILKVDLTEDSFDFITVSEDWISPSKRKKFCTVKSNNYFYIFGGLDDSGNFLNDMWRFSLELSVWNTVYQAGTIPSPRSHMGCADYHSIGFILFGGTDADEQYNDIHYFNGQSHSWSDYSLKTNEIAQRYDSCVCLATNGFYIIGGRSDELLFDDIWFYDNSIDEAIQININDNNKIGLKGHNCWVTNDEGYDIIHVIGGCNLSGVPNENYYQIKVASNDGVYETSTSVLLTSQSFYMTENSLIISGDIAYVFPGSIWEDTIESTFSIFYFKENHIVSTSFPEELQIYGYGTIHYKNSFYIFGGAKSSQGQKFSSILLNTVYKVDTDSDDVFTIQCSEGTLKPDCVPCSEGTYYMDNECVPCALGTFSEEVAASSYFSCTPCEYGYFNDKLGSTYCKICPISYYCQVGCKEPEEIFKIPDTIGYQPDSYSATSYQIISLVSLGWYGAIIIALCGILTRIKGKILEKFDLYTNIHFNEINTPIIYKKTRIGGIFSLIFVFIAIIIAVDAFLAYLYDNVAEIKSTLPLFLLEEEIKADSFQVTATFYRYGGDCAYDYTCLSSNIFTETGIQYVSRSSTCKQITSDCQVTLKYTHVSLTDNSKITFGMKENFSYASGLSVNVSSSSSIPDSISGVFISLLPDSVNKIFKGQTPTTININYIPSVNFI